MNILRKLFSSRAASPSDVEFHKSKIDAVAFRRIYDQYIDADPYPGFSKYLDLDSWIRTALSHVEILDLPAGQRLSILDIGTGAAYFSFVCQNMGHRVQSIDVPDNEFYTEMVRLLGVSRCEHRIESFQPLPDLGPRYDVVTAFAICFNNHANDELWQTPEWEFFLTDLRTNVVNPGALLYLKFNPEPNGQYLTESLTEFFRGQGASIDGAKVRLEL